MKRSGIGVLTMTYFSNTDELRFRLARQTIGDAACAGYHVVVLDGSPDKAIAEDFQALGAVVVKQTVSGMGAARRELFACALSHCLPIFMWTEPEKVDIVRLIPRIIAPLENEDAEIAIPCRTDTSWASYPSFQVDSERKANAIYTEVAGKNLDPMFGPVAFRALSLPYFAKCNPAKSYGAADTYTHHIAVLEAMVAGHRVASVPVDFYYPLAQRAEEEALGEVMKEKRQRQLDECANTYRRAAAALGLGPLKQ
jgi:hypothetical protein